jgi:regulator of replication initiation timing
MIGRMAVSVLHDLLGLLSTIPGAAEFWRAVLAWWAEPLGQRTWEIVRIIFSLLGLWEFVKYLDRRIFKRRSHLEQKVELLQEEVDLNTKEITELRAENRQLSSNLEDARGRLPQAAIARADREWRDHNTVQAIRQLERWFEGNAESITVIALRLAKFHISRSVPDPGDHLDRAHDMLRLARGARPGNVEVDECQANSTE